jgi:hypothetical protein
MKTFLEFVTSEQPTIEEEIASRVDDERGQQALVALYNSINEENKDKFRERLDTDTEKLVMFALSKFEE